MIPFTPDERRAQFAPSQNTGGPIDRDVLDIIGGQQQPTTVQQVDYTTEQVKPIDPDVLDIANQSQIPLMTSLMGASRVNPDQAAEATRLGSQVGIGQDIALRNMDEVRQRAFMADVQRRDISRANPVLAGFLSDRAFANEASDDIGTLERVGSFFTDVGRAAAGMPMQYIPGELARGFMRGQLVAERGEIGTRAIAGEAEETNYARAKQIQEEMRGLAGGGILASTAEVVAQNLAQAREVVGTGLVGGAAGSVIPGIGTMAGLAGGLGTGIVLTTAKMEAGNAYLDMQEQGISDETAVPVALGVGLLNGIVEAAGAKIAAAPFKQLANRVMREQIAEAVRKPTMRAALAAAGKSYVLQVGTEAAEEGVQEIVNIAGEELARGMEGIDSETTMRDAAKRVLDSFVQGAMGSAILGGIGPGANLYVDLRKVGRAQKQTKFFTDLSQNASESKLKARDPGAYERFVAATAQGTGADTVFVDAATMRGVLSTAGVTDAQLDAVAPGLSQQVREAAETGNDVTIPTAQFAARLAGTQIGDSLLPHMRLSPDAMSATEAQAFAERRDELVQEAEKLLESKTATEEAFVREADDIRSSMKQQLVAAGRDDLAAEAESTIYQAMVVTAAAREGMTPKQYADQFGMREVIGPGVEPAAVMEQAAGPAQIEAQYQNAIKAGDIATAQTLTDAVAEDRMPDSQVRDADGKIMRVFHGTQRIDRVGNRLLKKRATSGPMPFFTNIRPIAEGYAQGKEDTSIEDIGYEQWIKYKPKGSRSRVTLDQAWQYLTPEQRTTATERLFTVGYQNPDEGTGPIVANTDTIASRDHVQYLLREARGNALAAAKELWLNSGSLFNDEQQFMDVLKGMGLTEGFVYDSPHAVNSGIIEAYINITNPLDTTAIPESVVEALQQRAIRIRKPAAQYGRDAWDKEVREPQAWMQRLRDDVKEGQTQAWTSIPDWVTDVLRKLGYDGIKDTGGKLGGEQHTVWIPFEPEQVKFANAITKDASGRIIPLSERFDVTSPMMYRQAARPQVFEQRPITPGFYSALERELTAIDAKAMAASGWKERIKGLVGKGSIKADELEWTGLLDWIDMQEGKVSKDTVLEFVRSNGVQVERVGMGGPPANIDELRNAVARAEMAHEDAREREDIADRGDDEAAANAATEAANQTRRALVQAEMALKDAERATETKYEKYQLPGGTNYREVLLTLPAGFQAPAPSVSREGLAAREAIFAKYAPRLAELEREYTSLMFAGRALTDAEAQRFADVGNERDEVEEQRNAEARAAYKIPERPTAPEYRSQHWDPLNVLVHLRMNDRVDADGKRVLFVEEVQSDWGQAGRKTGFVVTPQRRQEIEQEYRDAQAAVAIATAETKQAAQERFDAAMDAYNAEINNQTIPRAPFVETTDGWLNLGLKQVMLEAINGGYDRVAFVNGKQSADRYDLSQQVSRVYLSNMVFDGDTDQLAYATIVVTAPNGNDLIAEKNISPSRIEELIGKEAAQRLIASPSYSTNEGTPQQTNVLEGDGLKVGGEGMKEFYDSIVPAAMNKLLKKYGGGKIGTVEIDTRTPESEAYYEEPTDADILPQPGFAITPEMLKKMASGLPLFQAARGEARGGFDPRRMRLFLTKKQDASTAIHELTHFALQMMTNLAATGKASPQVLSDLDLLFQWRKDAIAGDTPEARLATWIAMSVDQQRTALQEPLAYNGEIYIFEGKAPTEELQGVFERLRSFMLRVYKSIRDEINAIYRREFGEDLPMLTDEVRGVFDRMLASDADIRRQAAINEMKPSFQTQAESGMDDAEWAAYQDMQREATEASITDLTKASLRQMQWLGNANSRILRDMQKKHDATRKEVASEVAAAVRLEPVYRAMNYLRYGKFVDADGQEIAVDGPHKLDRAVVEKMYELEPLTLRPDLGRLSTGKYGILVDGGQNPDMVAELFGYSSGDEMIRAIVAAKPIKEAVDERTDAEMTSRYGDMNTREAQEAAVQTALHNEARARFVAVEYRFFAKLQQPVRVLTDAAKAAAQQVIGRKRLRDIRPSEFVAAESKASRAALEAMRDNRPADAVTAKRHQLLNNHLARAALDVREDTDKKVKYLRKVLRDTNVKAMGAEAADQIGQLLERFEVAAVSLKRLDERKTLAEFLAGLETAGLVPDIGPELPRVTTRINYRELTVAQFNDLVEAVKQIEYIGKNARKVQLAADRAAYEEKRDEIVTRIRAVGRLRGLDLDPRSPLTNIGRKVAALRGFAAQHLKASSIAYILDGGKDDGPLWNFVIRTANAAANKETSMRAEASAALAKIMAPVFALGNMGGKGMFFPSINRSLNREARIAIALNMGNAGNMQRLLDGEGWTMAQLQPVLESLTEAEWNAVQQVWDYMETYRPLIAEKERRLYGKEPNWVEPQPLTVRTADGKTMNLKGGYYPVKYDPVASNRVANIDAVEEAKRALDGAYTAATTRRSFTKARVKKVEDRPILYTLDAAFSGVNDVIHDLNWHEWLIQTNRLLRDSAFVNAVRETRGPEFLKQLLDWTKDNAAGEGGVRVAGEAALSWLRRGISASGLGFNVVSAAMQVTGFNQSIVKIGAKYVGRGIAQFAASPIDTAQMVADRSSFMRERGRTQFREINEIRNRVRGQTEVARRVTSGTYFLMMNMQRTVDIPTWLGAYQKALDAGKDDATAVALADQTVRDTQGSGLISDLSAIERGGPMMKLFTVFYSYMNTVYNMMAMQTMTSKNRGKLAADYVMLLVVPVVLGQAIKSMIQPDVGDDELDPEALARKLAAEELSFLMGTMVIVREFGGAAQLLTGAEGVRMGYGGPAGLRAVGEVYGLATQAGQFEFDRAFRRSAINTLGAFTGLPSAQINRTIDGIEALMEGEVEGPGAVLAPLTGVKR